jgi:hypothetical protein
LFSFIPRKETASAAKFDFDTVFVFNPSVLDSNAIPFGLQRLQLNKFKLLVV